MRSLARLLLVIAIVAGSVDACAQSALTPARPLTLAEVVGTWTGRWNAPDGAGGGSMELILASDPSAGADAVLGQLTFLEGGVTDSSRLVGRLTRDGIIFALVGGGTLSLTIAPDRGALRGDFDGGETFPVRRGSLELTRRS